MLNRMISSEEALELLDMCAIEELDEAVHCGEIEAGVDENGQRSFRLGEVTKLRLTRALQSIGVPPEKATPYSEAVLGQELFSEEEKLADWVENETQELFCLIADGELARIFLRGKETGKEVDIGVVKPVLFPVTKCEVNVFRVIRPVLFNALKYRKDD